MLLPLLVAGAALGGVPQCPPDLTDCYYGVDGVHYGDRYMAMQYMDSTDLTYDSYFDEPWEEELMCNRTRAVQADRCRTQCPLRFEITAPEELRTTFCIRDNSFTPYNPNAHLDANHLLNGQVLEVAAPGSDWDTTARQGCFVEDYTGDFSGKVALFKRGSCFFWEKFAAASAVGSVGALLVNNRDASSVFQQHGDLGMAGNTPPDIVAAGAAPQDADVLFEALDAGTRVYGKYVFECAASLTAPVQEEETAAFDGCPDFRYRSLCNGAAADEDRLCAKCPATLRWGAVDLCLWGNALFPRQTANFLQMVRPVPHAFADEEVVLMEQLPYGGCDPSDYEGLAGKVLITEVPHGACLAYKAARVASKAGLAAYISVDPMRDAVPVFADGPSQFVDIPVHSIFEADYKVLRDALGGDTSAVYLDGATLQEGAWLPKLNVTTAAPETEAPPPELPEPAAGGMTSVMVALTAVGAVLVVAIAALHCHQTRHAVKVTAPARQVSIPLGVANIGLSLTLLIVTAVVAFLLAYTAGQDATHSAQRDGKLAAETTYRSAAENVGILADQLRANIIAQVRKECEDGILDSETTAQSAVAMFMGFDGSWASFESQLPAFANFAQAHLQHGKTIQVFTTNGFYVSPYGMTDNRPDDERSDGVVGSVAETNLGWLYGFIMLYFEESVLAPEFWTAEDAKSYNLSHQWGGRPGDPTWMMDQMGRDDFYWEVTKNTFPLYSDGIGFVYQPMSVFTPLFNREHDYVGVVEVQLPLATFGTILEHAVAAPELVNMTVAVFDSEQTVLASNTRFKKKARGLVLKTTLDILYGTYTMHDIPSVQIKAFSNYADSVDGWQGHRGEFEQRAHWSHQHLTAVRVRVVDGKPVDVSGDRSEVELRAGQPVDVRSSVDADDGREVLHFDGHTVLHVYRNMTLSTPRVAETLTWYDDGSYTSSLDEYSHSMQIDGSDTVCVSHTSYTDTLDGTTECMLKESILKQPYTVSVAVRPDHDITAGAADAPILFTDTRTGDANIRVMGDGQLRVSLLTYGCITQPVEGGLPGGVWTTLTAVIDPEYYTCTMYANGTLVDTVWIADAYVHGEMGEAYLVGQGFRGHMDNLTVYNISVSAAEALSIHETGDLVREVEEQWWFADLDAMELGRDKRFGDLAWRMVAMIPRDDIMRQVDEKNRITNLRLAVQEENARKGLEQRSRETVLFIVVIALLTVLIFVFFNHALTKPFAECADLMADAAVMRVDVIPETRSYLTEINAMNASMALMLQNLKEFKSYMPQTLVLESSDADSDAVDVRSVSTKGSEGSDGLSPNRIKFGTSSGSGAKSSVRTSGNSSYHAKQHALLQTRNNMTLTLVRKKASYAMCNVKGFLKTAQELADAKVIVLHALILEEALGTFARNKGVPEVFNGDRFVASFNAVRSCVTHRTSSCAAAVQLRDQAAKLSGVVINAAVVCGDGRVGNCGNAVMKKFTFIASAVPWGHALERFGAVSDVAVLADMYVYDEASLMFLMKHILQVSYVKRSLRHITCAEVVAPRDNNGDDEWMYQIEGQVATDPFAAWNKHAAAVFTGDWAAAKALRDEVESIDASPWGRALCDAVDAGVYSPVTIVYH